MRERITDIIMAPPQSGRLVVDRSYDTLGEARHLDQYEAAIVIPARNEEAYIADAIACAASSAHVSSVRCAFVIIVNNSVDRTFDICKHALAGHECEALVLDCTFDPEIADIGHIRRFAIDVALTLLGIEYCLSTDADGRVSDSWVSRAICALDEVEMVCGTVAADRDDLAKLPESVRICGIVEGELRNALNDLWSLVTGPSRRGFTNMGSGANMAFRARSYVEAGRLPPVVSAEDRALHALFERQGRAISHDPEMQVVVSGRTSSAIENGMAACLASRSQSDDPFVDSQLMRAETLLRHALQRRGGTQDSTLPVSEPMRVSEARAEIRRARHLIEKLRLGVDPVHLLDSVGPHTESPVR